VRKPGFTFLEIMIVLVIIGIMATIVVPRLFYRPAKPPLDTFVYELNRLLQASILEAIRTELLHRLFFDFKKNQVFLEVASKKNVDPQAPATLYHRVGSLAVPTEIVIPENLIFRHFYIGAIDEMVGLGKGTIHFFIGPDGAVQEVTIVIADENNNTITLMTNPFSGQLVLYEGIKKP
jgi:prepilin-type N-terminal cleavage/methylation domain-containing protein